MALAGTMVWEVRTTGNAANSGGFNSAAAGTDRSQQDAPHVIIDGVTITATVNATTTDLDIVGYAVSAADIGNTVRIAGGTMTAGTYEITAIPAAGRWRLDRSGGTAGQTGTGRMGGANSDLALLAAVSVGFNQTWVKSGAYTITSATQNIAGGCPNMPNGAQQWEGYETVRGDLGTAPVFTASGINTATLLSASQNEARIANFEVDGAGLVAIRGIQTQGRSTGFLLTARNCTNSGITFTAAGSLIKCYATGCSTAGAGILQSANGTGSLTDSMALNNTVVGINAGQATVTRCISAFNLGAAVDGFTVVSENTLNSCVAYGNGRDGFRAFSANSVRLLNCLAEANGAFGFNVGNGTSNILINCAGFNNVSGNVNGLGVRNIDFVTGTATFFVDAAGGNYALNTTVGGGAEVRQNALPETFLNGLTTAYLDRGAVQTSGSPAESGGGGSGEVSIGQGTWIH